MVVKDWSTSVQAALDAAIRSSLRQVDEVQYPQLGQGAHIRDVEWNRWWHRGKLEGLYEARRLVDMVDALLGPGVDLETYLRDRVSALEGEIDYCLSLLVGSGGDGDSRLPELMGQVRQCRDLATLLGYTLT